MPMYTFRPSPTAGIAVASHGYGSSGGSSPFPLALWASSSAMAPRVARMRAGFHGQGAAVQLNGHLPGDVVEHAAQGHPEVGGGSDLRIIPASFPRM